MRLSQRKRQFLLVAALVATLLAIYFAPPEELSDVGTHKENSPVMLHLERSTPVSSARLWPAQRDDLAEEPGELFSVPPPPAPIRQAATTLPVLPPAPVAPPLPYVYMGKLVEGDVMTVFLTRQNKSYVVKAGDVLDGQYRVEAIEPAMVKFVYIPLGTTQLLGTDGTRQRPSTPLPPRTPAPSVRPSTDADAPPADDDEAAPDTDDTEMPAMRAPVDIQQKLKQLLINGANK